MKTAESTKHPTYLISMSAIARAIWIILGLMVLWLGITWAVALA